MVGTVGLSGREDYGRQDKEKRVTLKGKSDRYGKQDV